MAKHDSTKRGYQQSQVDMTIGPPRDKRVKVKVPKDQVHLYQQGKVRRKR